MKKEYVRQELVPTLRKRDIVVMDNLSFHKVAGVKEAKLRNVEELWSKLGELCDIFSPEECKNNLKNAGYKKNTRIQSKS